MPRFRRGVDVVPVGDEAIVYEEDTGGVHQLDHIAAFVCAQFDGRQTLEDVIDSLDASFSEDRQRIEADVIGLVHELAVKGLLEGNVLKQKTS